MSLVSWCKRKLCRVHDATGASIELYGKIIGGVRAEAGYSKCDLCGALVQQVGDGHRQRHIVAGKRVAKRVSQLLLALELARAEGLVQPGVLRFRRSR